jgi:hypothetical protein
VLTFTAAASLLAGVLFGLAPAWRATAVDLTPALKDSFRSADGGARLGLGKSLVVMQVALSLSLLIIAGLFARSLGKLYALDAGFKKENVLLVSTDARMIGYQGNQIAAIHQRLLERFKTIPGVRSASLGGGLLSEGGPLNLGALHIHGRPAPSNENPFLSPGQGGARKSEFVNGVGPIPEAQVTGVVKGNKVVFGFELTGELAQTVTFKGSIESAARMTGTVGSPFWVMVASGQG